MADLATTSNRSASFTPAENIEEFNSYENILVGKIQQRV